MPTNETPRGIIFSFAEMEREGTNMAQIASRYLDYEHGDGMASITAWVKQLKNFRGGQPGATLDWKIPFERPIRTKVSVGRYEPDGNGRHSVYGTVSSIWQIAIPGTHGRVQRRGVQQPNFEVVGKASTRVSVYALRDEGGGEEIARWRFEIGNADSPGCHFHTQVLQEENDVMFPRALSVPRFPNILFTPMDALEFVLAELFQEEWAQYVAKENDAIRNWAGCQKDRLNRVLKWQQDRLAKHSGSPWTSLKGAKPEADLLVGAK